MKFKTAFLAFLLLFSESQAVDKKISELNAITESDWATGDLFPMVDISATETKKTTVADFDARFISKDLNSAQIYVGNVSNSAVAVTPSGELTMDNSGVFTLSNSAVIGKVLSGYTTVGGSVQSTDTIIGAFEKLDAGKLSNSLTSAYVYVGNAANVATAVPFSGDISISSGGTTAYVGVVPLNKGGTGVAAGSANTAFNALSPLTTKGDLIGFSTVNARLPVGTDGQVLTADNAETLGVKWSTISTGGTTTSVYNAIVGSADDVLNGKATHTTFAAAYAFVSGGSTIKILPYTFNESVSINKNLNIECSGFGTVIGGSVTFGSDSDFTHMTLCKITDDVVFQAGATGLIFQHNWVNGSTTVTVTDDGEGNYIQYTTY